MIYILTRTPADDHTFGSLADDSGELCKTIELPWKDNHPLESCIPCGIWTFEKYLSPSHGQVWMAKDVPGRTNIEIHNANFASQLLGCIGVGLSIGMIYNTPAVLSSLPALVKLRGILPDTFQLNIINQ